jgi:hypothetical protein
METSHHRAVPVDVDEVRSSFLDRFATARPTTSYLMRDVDVVWTSAEEELPVLATTRRR